MATTESVIRRMTRLAVEHDAVNLSQGFTDERPPFELVWAAVSAMLGGTDEVMARLDRVSLRELVPGVAASEIVNRPLKQLLETVQGRQDRLN